MVMELDEINSKTKRKTLRSKQDGTVAAKIEEEDVAHCDDEP